MKIFLLLALAVVSSLATTTRYDGYQVFRVLAENQNQFDVLSKLQETTETFDFWSEPALNRDTDIMTPPSHANELVQTLKAFGMSYNVKIEDVQRLIEKNRNAPSVPQQPRSGRYIHNWTSYSRYSTIIDFINELAASYPNLVTVSSIGKTYESRDMYMMKISSGGSGKNAIFIDGGIHAREWISPAVVTYIISELVENYSAHPELVDNLDWYIVPVVNPDGYEYSHTTNRLWRKNRLPVPGNCFGVDNNRNFGWEWGNGGTSNSGCSELYRGTSAFSELESQNLRDAILSVAAQTKCYLTFHSYGQDMLIPWSYANSPLPDDYADLYAVGLNATRALTAVYGTAYGLANSYGLYGATAGSSDDWAKGGAGVKYAYTVELRDTGTYGFELPPNQILPTSTETWKLVQSVGQSMMNV